MKVSEFYLRSIYIYNKLHYNVELMLLPLAQIGLWTRVSEKHYPKFRVSMLRVAVYLPCGHMMLKHRRNLIWNNELISNKWRYCFNIMRPQGVDYFKLYNPRLIQIKARYTSVHVYVIVLLMEKCIIS